MMVLTICMGQKIVIGFGKGGLKMGLIDETKEYFFHVMAKKVAVKAVTIIVMWLTSGVAAHYLAQAGVTVDQAKLQVYLTGLTLTALKVGEDYVNLKYGWNI